MSNGNGDDAWRYSFTNRAAKELRKAEETVQKRVIEALDRLVADPSTVDIRKLVAKPGLWRLRVGSWRVIYTPDSDTRTYVILRVVPRSEDTYG